MLSLLSMRDPPFQRRGLEEFIDILPEGIEMVEIGCYAGEGTVLFLRKALLVVCVDAWAEYEDIKFGQRVYDSGFHDAEIVFNSVLQKFPSRVIKRKGTSAFQATLIDGSFDLVYIDACHTYESVVEDIKLWWPKLKLGGILAGHDFGTYDGVTRAVIELVGKPDRVFRDTTWMKILV